MKEVFPEIEIKKKIDDLKPYINNLVNDFDFAMEASRAITARFKKDYSAKSRALFLLDIMKRPNVILNESPYSRATAFTKY
ncbi:hypothetical protein D3C77_526680 [compost metagenome]